MLGFLKKKKGFPIGEPLSPPPRSRSIPKPPNYKPPLREGYNCFSFNDYNNEITVKLNGETLIKGLDYIIRDTGTGIKIINEDILKKYKSNDENEIKSILEISYKTYVRGY